MADLAERRSLREGVSLLYARLSALLISPPGSGYGRNTRDERTSGQSIPLKIEQGVQTDRDVELEAQLQDQAAERKQEDGSDKSESAISDPLCATPLPSLSNEGLASYFPIVFIILILIASAYIALEAHSSPVHDDNLRPIEGICVDINELESRDVAITARFTDLQLLQYTDVLSNRQLPGVWNWLGSGRLVRLGKRGLRWQLGQDDDGDDDDGGSGSEDGLWDMITSRINTDTLVYAYGSLVVMAYLVTKVFRPRNGSKAAMITFAFACSVHVVAFAIANLLQNVPGAKHVSHIWYACGSIWAGVVTWFGLSLAREYTHLRLDGLVTLFRAKDDRARIKVAQRNSAWRGWELSTVYDIPGPMFAAAHAVVIYAERWLRSLSDDHYSAMVASTFGVFVNTIVIHFISVPGYSILPPLMCSSSLLVVLLTNLFDSAAPSYLRPLWLYGILLFSSSCFATGCIASDPLHQFALMLTFTMLHWWAFSCAVLLSVLPTVLELTSYDVLSHASTWLRSAAGRWAALVYLGVHVGLFIFVLMADIDSLMTPAVLMTAIAPLLLPTSASWCLFIYIPLTIVFMTTALRLSDDSEGVVLTALSTVLIGPFMENAKIILDTHYTAALTGLGCLLLTFWNLSSVFWALYEQFWWPPIRLTLGLGHAFVCYLLTVSMHVLATYERHVLLYMAESGLAVFFFAIAFQAFLPVKLNTDGADQQVSEADALEFVKGGVDYKQLRKLGLTGLKDIRKAKKSKKHRQQRSGNELIIRNPSSLGWWQPLVYMCGLRIAYLADENVFLYNSAVVGAAASVLSIHKATFNAPLALALDSGVFVVGFIARARILTIVGSMLFNLHMALHLVRYMGLNEARLVTLVISVCIAQAVFAKNIVTYFQDSESLDDPFEEQAIENMFNWIYTQLGGGVEYS